jgi:hypothetical protein
MRLPAALLGCLVGCASAGAQNAGDDEPPADAPDPPIDAPSGPVTETLSQTTSSNIAPGNTINCTVSQNNVPVRTDDNSYYRVFPLASAGISGPFDLTSIAFGVETAQNPGGTQDVTVNVGTYSGTFDQATMSLTVAQLQQLATTTVAVANGDGTTINVPITATIPANSNLYVELTSLEATNNFLYPGSNNGGETFPSFLRAAGCGANLPTAYASLAPGTPVHLIITVTGTHTP